MHRILITGTNSFIGTSITDHLSQYPDRYSINSIDMQGTSWREESFRGYDTVFHVAGIAHDAAKNITQSQKDIYYAVNTRLAIETAEKAKSEGVHQFIFMSSSIVYGSSAPIGQTKIITRDTHVSPESTYGDSKAQAEKGLMLLDDDDFHVCILRCPMIYGKGCKGNYPLLSRLAKRLPVFPKVNNSRSMLYVKNLAEFVRLMIENDEHGIFWPQNSEYSNTSELVKMIAEVHDRKIIMLPLCEVPLKILGRFTGLVDKAFGSLTYDMTLSEYKYNYRLYTLRQSIEETEAPNDA